MSYLVKKSYREYEKLCGGRFVFRDVSCLESDERTVIPEDENLNCAMDDILLINDILQACPDIPHTKVWSDEIVLYKPLVSPELYTHINIYEEYMSLHFFISPKGGYIFGNIKYDKSGIAALTFTVCRGKSIYEILCSGHDGNIRIDKINKPKKIKGRHRLPFIVIDKKGINVLSATVLLCATIISFCLLYNSGKDAGNFGALIIPSEEVGTETQRSESVSETDSEPDSTAEIMFDNDYGENAIFTAEAGEKVILSMSGEPDTSYSISVYYSSGKSSASGLEDKTADENGVVSWSWTVGAKTKSGIYKAVISDGRKENTVYFYVSEK